jgi:hypothetical protein
MKAASIVLGITMLCGLNSAQETPSAPPNPFPEVNVALNTVLPEISEEEAQFTEPPQPENKEFTVREFAEKADLHAWVLVQHADGDLPSSRKCSRSSTRSTRVGKQVQTTTPNL